MPTSSEPPPSPAPDHTGSSVDGATLELTGSEPKIIFGSVEDPTCELSLDRSAGAVHSSCAISTPSEAFGRRLGAEEMALREEISRLRAEVVELHALWNGVLERKARGE